MNYYERAKELREETVANRRYLHTNAEVGLNMPKAQAFVMGKLKEYGKRMAWKELRSGC